MPLSPASSSPTTTSGGATTVTGARIIPLPSGGDMVRTGAGASYSFEIPDQQGTNDLLGLWSCLDEQRHAGPRGDR